MSASLRVALVTFGVLGLVLMLLGGLYLTTDQFMPYHGEALQMAWSDLGANQQGLTLGLIKGLGAGALIAGAAIMVMAVTASRRDPAPFRILLPLVAIGYWSLLCYATYTVHVSTPGSPPLVPNAVAVVVAVVAAILMETSLRRRVDR